MLSDLNELRTFREVLSHGSLSAAARVLGVSVAVVSKRLQTLENRVDARLVNRTTRSLSPTERGGRLLIEVERVLKALRQAEEALLAGRDEPAGMLAVSAPVSFGRSKVAPVLGNLARLYPRLRVGLHLNDCELDLVADGIDVAIRFGMADEGRAIVRRLAENQRILVAAPSYLDARGRPETPADLGRHDMLRYGGSTGPLHLIHRDGRTVRIPAEPRLSVDNGDAAHDWCLTGHGIILMSVVDVTSDVAAGSLERVLSDWSNGEMPVVAVFSSDRNLSKNIRVFVDAMAEALKEACSAEHAVSS